MKINKKVIIPLLLLFVFVIGGGAGYFAGKKKPSMASTKSHDHSSSNMSKKAVKEGKELYTCPMHPFIITEEPGSCPICGMTLVSVKGQREVSGDSAGSGIKIDPVVRQNMGIRTGTVERGVLRKKVRTVGMITYDERKIASVNTKITGWVEKLYVDETGQSVKKGQPLLEIYSPELVSAQKELLIALRHLEEVKNSPYPEVVEGAKSLLEAAQERLRLWDISDREIKTLVAERRVRKRLVISSPNDGIVVSKNAFQGTHIMPGAELYRVADISTIWVDADIYEYELPWIKVGQEALVTLDYLPGQSFRGKIAYVYPYLEEKTKTAKIRVEIENKSFELKPDMYAHVDIEADPGKESLIIPSDAVIRTGLRSIVFVEVKKGEFAPMEVELGFDSGDGKVQVISGVKEGERIVLSGQFMLDSESSIREAIRKMSSSGKEGKPEGAAHMGHTH
jgi:Cu(I)/Ag(I) efflux system membrane fusion protein/cobalt-zinc-cadmium efflux system membrane fusion protein